MEVLAPETNIPTRETVVAIAIANGGHFALDPKVLMVHMDYPDNHPDFLRPVQGGEEEHDEGSKAATAVREIGEETGIWLKNPLVLPLHIGRTIGVPRVHEERGLYVPRYHPYAVFAQPGQSLHEITPQLEENIDWAGWVSFPEAHRRAQLINRPLTRNIIGRALTEAFNLSERIALPAHN